MIYGGTSALTMYHSLEAIIPKREEVMAKNPVLAQDMDYFNRAVKDIEEPEDLFKDYRLLKIVLSAYGLETEINKMALVKKTLMSDPKDLNSLVNKMKDPRYKEMHEALGLDRGTFKLKLQSTPIELRKKLVSTMVEKQLDEQVPGIRRAMHFKRTAAAGAIEGPFNLLADSNLRDVALMARNLPRTIVNSDIDTQGRTLEKFFDFDLFSDEKYTDKIIQQYLVQLDIQTTQAANHTAGFASMMLGTSGGFGFNLTVGMLT
jgi:hypothetical protein